MAEEAGGNVVADANVENMQMLWNIFKEVSTSPLQALPKPTAGNAAFYGRVLVGERKLPTSHRALHDLLRRRAGQPLTMSWVLYAMLHKQCARDDVDMQALLDGDQRNGKGRKRHTGMFNTGSNKKSREAAADAGDDNTAPVFRILDRCLERPPSRLTDHEPPDREVWEGGGAVAREGQAEVGGSPLYVSMRESAQCMWLILSEVVTSRCTRRSQQEHVGLHCLGLHM